MFTHVMVGAKDLEASRVFYDATFAALGGPQATILGHASRYAYVTPTGVFMIAKPINRQPAIAANGGTIGFVAQTPEQVDAWHAAGIANGGVSIEDPPGIRKSPVGDRYAAYLRDPTGNKICAISTVPE